VSGGLAFGHLLPRACLSVLIRSPSTPSSSGLRSFTSAITARTANLFLPVKKSFKPGNILPGRSVLMHECSACAGRLTISPVPSSRQHERQYEKPSPGINSTTLRPPRLPLRIYSDRTSGRYRHHRNFGSVAPAIIEPSQAKDSGCLLHEQYEADDAGVGSVIHGQRRQDCL